MTGVGGVAVPIGAGLNGELETGTTTIEPEVEEVASGIHLLLSMNCPGGHGIG
jgi:hypothetical protein